MLLWWVVLQCCLQGHLWHQNMSIVDAAAWSRRMYFVLFVCYWQNEKISMESVWGLNTTWHYCDGEGGPGHCKYISPSLYPSMLNISEDNHQWNVARIEDQVLHSSTWPGVWRKMVIFFTTINDLFMRLIQPDVIRINCLLQTCTTSTTQHVSRWRIVMVWQSY